MIGLDQFFDDGVTFLRKALVNPAIFSRTTVLAADLHPCDFLVPYINSSLRSIAKVSRRHGRMEPKHASEQTANSFDWEWNQANYRNLMRSCGTISQYLEMKYPIPSGQQPRLAEVIRQYSALIAETRENAGQLQTRIQNYTSGQAILEARKGIEQANAVRRYAYFSRSYLFRLMNRVTEMAFTSQNYHCWYRFYPTQLCNFIFRHELRTARHRDASHWILRFDSGSLGRRSLGTRCQHHISREWLESSPKTVRGA